jgi:4-hydroxy-3-methylbut-2-enyl diphosphate reductase
MAQVIVADKAGACFGVERAIELVRAATENAEGDVFTLGPLIHNPRVVDELEHAGVHVASSVDEAAGGTLILRTHGVKPSEQARAEEVCSEVVDATCPFVKKVHRAVERLTRDGFEVVVVGEKGHPEVDAALAHADGSQAIADADEARSAELGSRVGIVVQTTQTASNLADVVSAIDDGSREVEVVNTI